MAFLLDNTYERYCNILKRNRSILQSGKYSDLKIRCGKESLAIHRAIVCPASKFFASACDGDFKEAHTGVINLDDPVNIVRMMISYCYTQGYDDKIASSKSRETGVLETGAAPKETNTLNARMSEAATIDQVDEGLGLDAYGVRLMNNVRVYAIADKYDIPGLKEMARTRTRYLANVYLLLKFPSIICEIYDTTPAKDRGLRDIVSNICAKDVKRIFDYDDWSAAAQMRVEFTFDLLRAYATIHEPIPEKIECASVRKRKRSTAGPR